MAPRMYVSSQNEIGGHYEEVECHRQASQGDESQRSPDPLRLLYPAFVRFQHAVAVSGRFCATRFFALMPSSTGVVVMGPVPLAFMMGHTAKLGSVSCLT